MVSGVVRKVDADSFELEAEDTRFLIIQFSASVPKPADFRVGDGLDVTANVDADGMFHLVSMTPNKKIADTINEADSIGPGPGALEEGKNRTAAHHSRSARRRAGCRRFGAAQIEAR